MEKDLADRLLVGVRLAVVGVAKNCGKTTTLNALSATARRGEETVGLVSIGIDGEAHDVLLGTDKPPVIIAAGDWVVGASRALQGSSARFDYVESLDYRTPLGEVVLARVIDGGDVVLAGIRHLGDLREALDRLEPRCDRIFIDGAYARTTAARPDISDAVIVSTGAVVGTDIPTIVERTAAFVEPLTLPEIGEPWAKTLMKRALEEERALLGGPDIEPRALPEASALLGLPRARSMWTTDTHAIAVPGVVSDAVLSELLAVPEDDRTLLLRDGTAIGARPKLLRKLRKRWKVEVLRQTRITGMSVNPTSMSGADVDARGLCSALGRRWTNIPVFDPLADLQSNARR